MTYFDYKGKIKYHTCKIDSKEYCITNGRFNRYLKSLGMSVEDYYLKYIGVKQRCISCEKASTFIPESWTYKQTCGSYECIGIAVSNTCAKQSVERKKKIGHKKSKGLKLFYATDEGKKVVERIKEAIKPTLHEAKEKRRATSLARYGDATYSNQELAVKSKMLRSSEERTEIAQKAVTTKREQFNGNMFSEEGFLAFKRRSENGEYKEAYKKAELTWMRKYGVPFWPGNRMFGSNSKPQARLCNVLFEKAGGQCANHGGEFRIGRKFYDYRLNDKIIEFNGDYWHANPNKYEPDQLIKYPKGRISKASEVWDKDKLKIQAAIDAGFKVLIVWEHDFYKNEEEVIQKCLTWLTT